jgi:hypothetical protein
MIDPHDPLRPFYGVAFGLPLGLAAWLLIIWVVKQCVKQRA